MTQKLKQTEIPLEQLPQPQANTAVEAIDVDSTIDKISALTLETPYWTCKWRFDESLHNPNGPLSNFPMGRCNCTGHSGPLCSTDEKQWWHSRVRCDKDGNLLT
jgi:hypothetical protein